MKIKTEDVEKIVRRAAEFAVFETAEITEKDGATNIVTSADVAVQKFLCAELSKLIDGSGFYCEEENLRDTKSEYVWIIDPIDGTMNFSRGIGDFCISVGLMHNRRVILGVVYMPAHDEMFSASDGEGAFLNGKQIHVSNRSYENSILCTALCTYKKELAPYCEKIIKETFYQINDVRRFGTCAEELCYIACGRCEMFFEIRIFPWDYAGASVILKEAGGFLRGLNCEELTYDKPTVLIGSNSKANLHRLSETVSKHIRVLPYSE